MFRFEFSKLLFFFVSIGSLVGLSFAFGVYSGVNETVVYQAVNRVKNEIEQAFKTTTEEIPTLTGTHPTYLLQPARYEGSGVTVNTTPNDDRLIFLSGFFDHNNELRLMRRNGDIVARWPVRFSEIFSDTSHLEFPPKTDWNIDIHGAVALPDGSVVFNFEYGGLVKLDRCGGIVWTLAHETHHSVERAEGGGFWVPGRRFHRKGSSSPFPPFITPYYEDTLLKVSEDGKVVTELSLPGLLYDNNLEPLLTATGDLLTTSMKWDKEIVHLNKIDELNSEIAADFPMFEAGDLVLSMRNFNLLTVVDPDSGKIKWWQVGPWLRQHDPEFKAGGSLVLFNNNTYRTAFAETQDISAPSLPRITHIGKIDPVTRQYEIVYGGNDQQQFLSVIRGKVELTDKGGLLVTEFEGGRVFETDASGSIVWEYINRYSPEEVAEVTEARIYPSDYFEFNDWSCEPPGT